MAKAILSFFGGTSIIIGFLIILAGAASGSGAFFSLNLGIGAALLISGAPLLGFARVITLLEEIKSNTSSAATSAIISSVGDGSFNPREYIRRSKPAFSATYRYEAEYAGDRGVFRTDAEAVAFVIRARQRDSNPAVVRAS